MPAVDPRAKAAVPGDAEAPPPGAPSGGTSDTPAPDPAGPEGSDDGGPLGELGNYIRDQRERARLTLRGLSKIAGVSNPYLSQIERGLRKPSAEILQAIAKALHISSETLYVKAGILDERDDEADVERAITRDLHLTESQRQSLLEMYRSYRTLAALQAAGAPSRRPASGSEPGTADAASFPEPTSPSADDGDDLHGNPDVHARPGDRLRIREFIDSVRPERDPRDDRD